MELEAEPPLSLRFTVVVLRPLFTVLPVWLLIAELVLELPVLRLTVVPTLPELELELPVLRFTVVPTLPELELELPVLRFTEVPRLPERDSLLTEEFVFRLVLMVPLFEFWLLTELFTAVPVLRLMVVFLVEEFELLLLLAEEFVLLLVEMPLPREVPVSRLETEVLRLLLTEEPLVEVLRLLI